MPLVTFIGGFKDGEKSDMPSVEPRVEFKEIEPPRFIDFIPDKPHEPFGGPMLSVKSDWYRLEHIVSHEEKFWFYVEENIAPDQWIQRLVGGYNPIREEED